MRTGKERTFVIDETELERTERKRREGRGLVGGDIDRIPHKRRGLAPHLDFDDVPEVRRACEDPQKLREQEAFLAHRPLDVEIGFGGGDFIFHQALNQPDTHFLGFEIRRHLCLSLAKKIHKHQLKNLRICYEDVRQAMPQLLEDHSIRRCSIFFPDPWWKKKHIKRRLLAPSFLDLMSQKLMKNGILHIKTDVLEYGELIQKLLDADERFEKAPAETDSLFENDHPTEREAFCIEKGLPFVEFRYILKN